MVTSVSNVSLFLMGLAICNVLLALLTPVTLVLADSCDSLLADSCDSLLDLSGNSPFKHQGVRLAPWWRAFPILQGKVTAGFL
jgi:hypothetical protein